ncbi:flagellar basal body-associated protein FliL [Arsukibacterium sp.]|uniref:flagellar basal body-associated protein FliL n=1 Tax=Arsukibacterium sp. TaxID=1977258 RepID=UPI002FDA31D6
MKIALCFSLLLSLICLPLQARQQQPDIVYYGFDPDIVTNYVSGNRRSLGYIRVTVELMITDRQQLRLIEHHEPLILDTIIGIFSKQPEDKIKSLTGREEIRLNIRDDLQKVLVRETGQPIIQDILFTKYLYQ